MSVCTRCKLRRYCSQSCQKFDWIKHKDECFLRPGKKTSEEDEKEGGTKNNSKKELAFLKGFIKDIHRGVVPKQLNYPI